MRAARALGRACRPPRRLLREGTCALRAALRCDLPAAAVPARLEGRRPFSEAGHHPAVVEDKEPSYATGELKGYKIYYHDGPFQLSTGGVLEKLQVAYETWGDLNHNRDNAILLQCGMSASSHACSHPQNPAKGWWEDFVGPGKPLDTNLFHVICTNNLGGCYGTTGPSSLHPKEDGRRYGSRFPRFEVKDMVAAQFALLDHLDIRKLHACVGSSLGGMQSICAAALYPERVGKFVTISACAKSFPGSIAFRHAQRTAIMQDPYWNHGDYYEGRLPEEGLRLARELGTITYRSGKEWQDRFGQARFHGARKEPDKGLHLEFEIERYLSHQGKKWVNNYDPNSMLWISKAMDGFTMEEPGPDGRPCLKTGLSTALQPALVIGVQYDVLFPVWQQKEIADTLRAAGNRHVVYYELDCAFGHDSFLLDAVSIGPAVKGHLEQEPGGARHIWEERAANSHKVLQAVSNLSNLSDCMRSMFRALAGGSETVDRNSLKIGAKLMFAKGGLTDWRIDQIFEQSLPSPQVRLADFLQLREKLAQCRDETYLP